MGDGKKGVLSVAFDKRIRLEFHRAKITSDGGLLLYRELDEALGLTDLDKAVLGDTRTGKNTQHKMTPLLRQSIYSRLAGYEDTNDAERLRVDPAMRQLGDALRNAWRLLEIWNENQYSWSDGASGRRFLKNLP